MTTISIPISDWNALGYLLVPREVDSLQFLYKTGYYGYSMTVYGYACNPTPVERLFHKAVKDFALDRNEVLYLACEQKKLILLDASGQPIERDDVFKLWKSMRGADINEYAVYRYFRNEGFIVRRDLTMSSTFALYEDKPSLVHSLHLVYTDPEEVSPVLTAGRLREARAVRKSVFYARLEPESKSDILEDSVYNKDLFRVHVKSMFVPGVKS